MKMTKYEKQCLIPLGIGSTLLIVAFLCKAQLPEYWQGFLCGMSLMCDVYALIFMVRFFKDNLKRNGNSKTI